MLKRVDMDENVVSADLKAANSSSGYQIRFSNYSNTTCKFTSNSRTYIAVNLNSKYNQSISSLISVPLNQNEQLSVSAQSLTRKFLME